jgi:hypothetical protein
MHEALCKFLSQWQGIGLNEVSLQKECFKNLDCFTETCFSVPSDEVHGVSKTLSKAKQKKRTLSEPTSGKACYKIINPRLFCGELMFIL